MSPYGDSGGGGVNIMKQQQAAPQTTLICHELEGHVESLGRLLGGKGTNDNYITEDDHDIAR